MSDRQDAATALLETKRQVLTGLEVAICERIQSGAFEADVEMLELTKNAKRCPHCDEFIDEHLYQVDAEKIEEEEQTFKSLEIQFSREIGEWIAKRDRDYSRERTAAYERTQHDKSPQLQLI